MDCNTFGHHLDDLARGGCPKSLAASLKAHAERCPTCRAQWATLTLIAEAMADSLDTAPSAHGSAPPALPADFTAQVMARIRSDAPTPKAMAVKPGRVLHGLRWTGTSRAVLAAAAAAVAVCPALWWGFAGPASLWPKSAGHTVDTDSAKHTARPSPAGLPIPPSTNLGPPRDGVAASPPQPLMAKPLIPSPQRLVTQTALAATDGLTTQLTQALELAVAPLTRSGPMVALQTPTLGGGQSPPPSRNLANLAATVSMAVPLSPEMLLATDAETSPLASVQQVGRDSLAMVRVGLAGTSQTAESLLSLITRQGQSLGQAAAAAQPGPARPQIPGGG